MKKAKSLLSLVLALLIALGGTFCAFAAEDLAESEDNGTIATADAFGVGASIKGKIDEAGDEDYYSFTSTQTGLVTITLKHNAKSGADPVATYFEVSVMTEDGSEIDSFVSTGAQETVSIEFSVIPGVYYAKVEGGSVLDTTLEYTLTTKINTNALFEKEPNDISSQATVMQLSKLNDTKLYYGAVNEDDVDYYAVTFSKPCLSFFGIYNTASKSGNFKASFVKVVDGLNGAPAEKVIGTIEINDGQTVVDSPLFGVNGGTYYLKVESVGNSTGGYQVRVFEGASNSTDEFEYNNEEKYANRIAVGKSMTANIFDTTDTDMFVFDAPKGNNGYKITFVDYDGKKAVTNGQWILEVVDENGDVVEDKLTVTNAEKVVAETAPLDAGTYYIKVVSGNIFTGETYKVTLEQKPASEEPVEEPGADGKITIDEFFKNIFSIDWSGFWNNFKGWLEYVNVLGIGVDLMKSVIDFITTFLFANM